MQRNVDALSSQQFDLLVVGGGIYGACIARDAALRGLSVALIEKGDFCSETSHNSAKILHGGIRYLQHLDLRRVRESVVELGIWLSIAPHLVRPLKFVIPTQGYISRGPVALQVANLLHSMIGYGTQKNVQAGLRTPIGRVYGRAALREFIPDLRMDGLTGAASWHDGQYVDAAGVVLECIKSAVENGAVVANYVVADSILRSKNKVLGVNAHDLIGHGHLSIEARMTVFAGGPWAEPNLRRALGRPAASLAPPLAKNMNIVTRRLFGDYGVGIPSNRKSDAVIGSESRLFFVTPWKDVSVIGTTHFPYDGDPGDYRVTDDEIDEFVEEVSAAYPPAELSRQDIYYVYSGLTPADPDALSGEVGRSKRAAIIDHSQSSDLAGLITVIGVKFTTGRLVAERVVTLIQQKLKQAPNPLVSRTTPLPGARGYILGGSCANPNNADDRRFGDLLGRYGSQLPKRLQGAPVGFDDAFGACVEHAVRNEMAMTLNDVLLRRSDLVERGLLTEKLLIRAANVVAKELGWDNAEAERRRSDFRKTVRYLATAPDDRGSHVAVSPA